MSLISIPFTFSVGAVIVAAQHNSNFSTIYNDYNGNITDANIASNAAIEYSKLSLTGSIVMNDLSTALTRFIVPSGGIIMWSGTIATIPSGWFLCDGTNSTPDLRNRFIVAADADAGGIAKSTITGSALQSGGSTTILQANLPSYNLSATAYYANAGASTGFQGTSGTGSSPAGTNVPSGGSGSVYTQPFYALAYIMKS